jgi:hypothetical protein
MNFRSNCISPNVMNFRSNCISPNTTGGFVTMTQSTTETNIMGQETKCPNYSWSRVSY